MDSGAGESGRWGTVRSALWPVHPYEVSTLIPLLLIAFFLTLPYNMLRTLKDTLVLNAANSGAETIPFIKMWVMLPMAVLITFFYGRLSHYLKKESLFYAISGSFLTFFALFIWVLYPNHEALQLTSLAQWLRLHLPLGAKGFIAMIEHWSFSIFYAFSELWGSSVFFMLYWSFVNEISSVTQAKRFYGLIGGATHLTGICAGPIAISLLHSNMSWEAAVQTMVLIIIASGLLAIGVYRWMHVYLKRTKEARGPEKIKVSLGESLRHLKQDNYLRKIASIVLSYNIVINLVEVFWKAKVKELYPDPKALHIYMCQVTTIIGIVAAGASFTMVSSVIRRLGWTFTAILTPIILLGTSVLFFGSMFVGAPLALVVFLGSLQNALSRGAKYTVFDASKEIAFVPIPPESRAKGKTTIDGIGTRLGKSMGSGIHQTLLILMESLTNTLPVVAFILVGLLGGWVKTVKSLGSDFTRLTETERIPSSDEEIEQAVA